MAIPKLYAPVFTAERLYAMHDAILELHGESPFSEWLEGIPRDADAGRPITKIDVGPYIERARDALRAHRTQVDPDGFWFRVPTELLVDIYPYEDFELMASRVGPDGPGDDLFART